LQQHKEATLVCEEGIFEVEAIHNLLIPQSNKIILAQTSNSPRENNNVLYKLSQDKS
jgi:hypothetical protein